MTTDLSTDLSIFALEASRSFGEAVCAEMGVPLQVHEEREFEDGEHKARPLVSVRGKDVYVICSLHRDRTLSVNDKLCRLLFFVGALKDARAARVTVIAPYLCYARKDRRTKARDPVTTRYVACLFESVGTDCVVTVDVHNVAAFQNAFRCPTYHVEAAERFAEYVIEHLPDTPIAVVSPDPGGIKRAETFRHILSERTETSIPVASLEKRRSGGVVTGQTLVGDLRGRSVLILDDMISTGTTLSRAAATCTEHGAERVWAVATHGLFTPGAEDTLSQPSLGRIVVTNTVPVSISPSSTVTGKVEVLDIAPDVARAIQQLHLGTPRLPVHAVS